MLFLIFLFFVFGYLIIHHIHKKSHRNALIKVIVNLIILGGVSAIIAVIVFVVLVVSNLNYDPKDFDFSEEQLTYIGVLEKNDTLYFSNSKGERDTLVIDGITNDQKKEAGAIMVGSAYNHKTLSITRQSASDEKLTFTIGTSPQDKTRSFAIAWGTFHYYSDTALGLHKDTLVINNKRITDCSIIYTNTLGAGNYTTDVVTIIWTKKDGPVAYETPGGGYWLKE